GAPTFSRLASQRFPGLKASYSLKLPFLCTIVPTLNGHLLPLGANLNPIKRVGLAVTDPSGNRRTGLHAPDIPGQVRITAPEGRGKREVNMAPQHQIQPGRRPSADGIRALDHQVF